jgi:hypothetical protein
MQRIGSHVYGQQGPPPEGGAEEAPGPAEEGTVEGEFREV